jgi:predicted nuclease of predicted toxin-antitoxin system
VRFIADESCDFAIVRALRAYGHDIVAVSETSPRLPDEKVLAQSRDQGRVLLTEDKDFGELVYSGGLANAGVILIRFPAKARGEIVNAVVETVNRAGATLTTRFTVVQPGRTRTGKSH